ncbi:hypothetical protein AcV5_000773 [Taiwanofungus camphoratus]|nr:hypothetical protein AcV5_000773 [Antrodia cinnamomea]
MEVADVLRAGAFLTGSSQSEAVTNLKEVLQYRLTQYRAFLGLQGIPRHLDSSLEDVQLETASEALHTIERLQEVWTSKLTLPSHATSSRDQTVSRSRTESNPSSNGDFIGARDLAHIRTLISIIFKWAVEPLLSRVGSAIPTKSTAKRHGGAKIIDLTGVPSDYETLSLFLTRLMCLILPGGSQGPLSQTVITVTLLNRHLTDLLRPCIVLGWLPKSMATDSVHTLDDLRPLVVHLLSILPASQTIASLGSILSDAPSSLSYVLRSCSFLLSRQLLRPDGVHGLLTAVFGEEDGSEDDAPLEKLEHVGRLLSAVPAGMKPEGYYAIITPRLVSLLAADMPPAHRRAVAFSLSRMLASDENLNSPGFVSKTLLPILHYPFLTAYANDTDGSPSQSPDEEQGMTPSGSLSTLQTLLTNADPSPTFITDLLTPIVPALFAILSSLESTKTSDPAIRETVKGFLSTWGRVVGTPEGIEVLWRVVDGEGGEWQTDVAGEITKVEKADRTPSLSLFTPEDLRRAEQSGEFDVDSNLLDLRPDPVRFVRYLKTIERADISSELFVRLLEAYRENKADPDGDPLRTLLYLQLILQMQNQLSADSSSSNILRKPDHILVFIKHALESAQPVTPSAQAGRRHEDKTGLRMEDLRIIPEKEEEVEEGDSDDETPDAGPSGSSDQEMIVTAVNLLLSILEANADLSARTSPILNDIFSLLEPLAKDPSDTLRPLAREARMVMTARLASTSASSQTRAKRNNEEGPQETYQKALKLLQDPLLPVRAHGLLLLRQLVTARKSKSGSFEEPLVDRALVPGILSIFLQSVQDDDSYMYLNAVQGLSAMVDGFGKDVLKGLVGVYAEGLGGLGGSAMTQQDVDTRTRVGEALGQVIRRCGDTLPAYANILIPPLYGVVRAFHFPTILRMSAISLLAQCAKTNAMSVLSYAADLSEAMIDLLQVETVPAAPRPKRSSTKSPDEDDKAEEPERQATVDSQPTSANSKFPPLRRAALHFLSLVVRACTTRVYEAGDGGELAFPAQLVGRAKTTLGYVAATDEDAVVRVMARETLEGLDELAEAMLGL